MKNRPFLVFLFFLSTAFFAAGFSIDYEETLRDETSKKRKPLKRGLVKSEQQKTPWTPLENAQLLACIAEKGAEQWSDIAALMNTQFLHIRNGKQCRERYWQHLHPAINKSDFSEAEYQRLASAIKEYKEKGTIGGLDIEKRNRDGIPWSIISERLFTIYMQEEIISYRPDGQLKNIWYSSVHKDERKNGAWVDSRRKKRKIEEANLGDSEELSTSYVKLEDSSHLTQNAYLSLIPITVFPISIMGKESLNLSRQKEVVETASSIPFSPPLKQNTLIEISKVVDITDGSSSSSLSVAEVEKGEIFIVDGCESPLSFIYENTQEIEEVDADKKVDGEENDPFLQELLTLEHPLDNAAFNAFWDN